MTINLTHVRETEKAKLFKYSSGKQIWIPKSVIRSATKFPNGNQILTIEDWWWEKNTDGFDEEE